MIEDNDLQRLAAMAHALRPDWPIKSLVTYLHAKHAARPYRDVAVALAWIASESATKTPKRLEENGPWWAAAVAGDTTRLATAGPDTVADMRCPNCPHWVVRGEPHECAPLADPDPDRLAAIKAAIAPPPAPTDERPVEDVEIGETL